MSEWKNQVLAEAPVTDKVKWVLQRSTSPEGETMLGLRKFVETKAGVKPTGSGLSVKDVAEIDILIELLQKAKEPRSSYIIKDSETRTYVSGKQGKEIKFVKDKTKAKVFNDKETAKALRDKYGNEHWLVLKQKD